MTVAPSTQTDPTAVAGGPAAELSPAARVQQAATRAAERVAGVHELGTAGGRALVRAMGRVPGGRTTYGAGVSVEVGQEKAAIDLSLVVEHGTPVPALAEQVRSEVRAQVERDAGVEVVEVNVSVVGLHHPDDDVAPPEPVEVAPGPDADDAEAEASAGADAREADEAVQRIVARAAEDAAQQERADQSDAPSASNAESRTGGAHTVVMGDGTVDGPGPDVVVADQVVIAERVVVVDEGDDRPGTAEHDEHR